LGIDGVGSSGSRGAFLYEGSRRAVVALRDAVAYVLVCGALWSAAFCARPPLADWAEALPPGLRVASYAVLAR